MCAVRVNWYTWASYNVQMWHGQMRCILKKCCKGALTTPIYSLLTCHKWAWFGWLTNCFNRLLWQCDATQLNYASHYDWNYSHHYLNLYQFFELVFPLVCAIRCAFFDFGKRASWTRFQSHGDALSSADVSQIWKLTVQKERANIRKWNGEKTFETEINPTHLEGGEYLGRCIAFLKRVSLDFQFRSTLQRNRTIQANGEY